MGRDIHKLNLKRIAMFLGSWKTSSLRFGVEFMLLTDNYVSKFAFFKFPKTAAPTNSTFGMKRVESV